MEENKKNNAEISAEEEAKLAKMAARRVSFKIHLAIFVIANAFLWVVWYFLFRDSVENTFLMAILFVLIVWLLAIILHYMIVYKWTKSYKEKELTSLKKLRQQQLLEIENLKAEMKQDEGEEPEAEEESNSQKNSYLID